MIAIILEDDSSRISDFKTFIYDLGFSKVYFSKESVEVNGLLEKNSKEDITLFLDHDLNDMQMKFLPDNCGKNVTDYIINNSGLFGNLKIIVHSYNIYRAKVMCEDIYNHTDFPIYYYPSVWILEKPVKNNSTLKNIIKTKNRIASYSYINI